jgi:3-methyladenine DNA glycosylase AlkD
MTITSADNEIIVRLKSQANPVNVARMIYFVISPINSLGIPLPVATDKRNFVKKAVNWAIPQIGKLNLVLNNKAVALSEEIQQMNSPVAQWIAADALRELTSEAMQSKLKNKG